LADPALLTQADIRKVLDRLGLASGAELLRRVETYLTFLNKWNSRMNLTAIQSPLEILSALFAESFFAAGLLEDPEGPILDVGSGAGFPGLAMAVYRPELELILLEPRKKRAAFLVALQRELALPRVAVWNRRLEECAGGDFSQLPTVLTMRAVGKVADVVDRGIHFLQGSRTVLLFSSSTAFRAMMQEAPDVCWQPPRHIPWNPEHVVLLGQVQKLFHVKQ
jgi:16S rRNA (guanine527-N7)-methyltransferase